MEATYEESKRYPDEPKQVALLGLEATCEESKLGVHRLLRGEWSPVLKLPVRNPSNYIGIAENIGPVSGSYL